MKFMGLEMVFWSPENEFKSIWHIYGVENKVHELFVLLIDQFALINKFFKVYFFNTFDTLYFVFIYLDLVVFLNSFLLQLSYWNHQSHQLSLVLIE